MDIVRRKLILSPIGTYRAKRPSKCAVHLIESQIKEVKMKGRPNSYRCPFHRGIPLLQGESSVCHILATHASFSGHCLLLRLCFLYLKL